MARFDDFIDSQLPSLLQAGERPLYRANVTRAPGLFWRMVLSGGLLVFLMTKACFAVVTDRRLILIRTRLGFFGPKAMNLGIEEVPLSSIAKVTTSGLLDNRSITFHKTDGQSDTVRVAPWFEFVDQQSAFSNEMPQRVTTKQLQG